MCQVFLYGLLNKPLKLNFLSKLKIFRQIDAERVCKGFFPMGYKGLLKTFAKPLGFDLTDFLAKSAKIDVFPSIWRKFCFDFTKKELQSFLSHGMCKAFCPMGKKLLQIWKFLNCLFCKPIKKYYCTTFGWDAMGLLIPLGVISSRGMLQNHCIPPRSRAITYCMLGKTAYHLWAFCKNSVKLTI